MEATKKCPRCGEDLPLQKFTLHNKDHKVGWCRKCNLLYEILSDEYKDVGGVKFCPKCKRFVPKDHFYTSQKHKDGLQCYCKDCDKEHGRLRNGTTGEYRSPNITIEDIQKMFEAQTELLHKEIENRKEVLSKQFENIKMDTFSIKYNLDKLMSELADMNLLTTKEVLSSEETAKYMGISMSYLYKLTARQEIPHFKPMGKMCYFNRRELEEWLQTNKVATQDEINQQAQAYCMKNKR